MTKQELALSSFAQRISLGYLTVDIGDRLSFGEDVYSLVEKLRRVRQLNKLFDYEYGLANSNLKILQKIVFLVNTYLNNYRLNGTYVVAETDIVPVPFKYAHIIVVGGEGGGGGEMPELGSGLHEKNGKLNIGLDVSTIGTTKAGILTEPLYLTNGQIGTGAARTILIDDNQVFISVGNLTKHSDFILTDAQAIIGAQEDGLSQAISMRSDSTDSILIKDEIFNMGARYEGDYSVKGKNDNRWIPDWKAVKDYVAENGGGGGTSFEYVVPTSDGYLDI